MGKHVILPPKGQGEGKSGKYSRGGHSGQRERHVQRPWGRDSMLREDLRLWDELGSELTRASHFTQSKLQSL